MLQSSGLRETEHTFYVVCMKHKSILYKIQGCNTFTIDTCNQSF